jgi:hypothetical protein
MIKAKIGNKNLYRDCHQRWTPSVNDASDPFFGNLEGRKVKALLKFSNPDTPNNIRILSNVRKPFLRLR